jgi:hypothetical protein
MRKTASTNGKLTYFIILIINANTLDLDQGGSV